MASTQDTWHLAAARVSPMIWEVQKAQNWTVQEAQKHFKKLKGISKSKDYVGILTSEPELESERDRLVIIPINYPKSVYRQPFLVERERVVKVYDLDGELEFEGEMIPEQQGDFLKWCSGYFVRLVGVQPPTSGP